MFMGRWSALSTLAPCCYNLLQPAIRLVVALL